MRLLQFVPIKLAVFLIAGIVLGRYIDFGLRFTITFSSLCLVLLAYLLVSKKWSRSTFFGIGVLWTTLGIGIWVISTSEPKNRPDHYLNLVIRDTAAFHVKIREVLKPTAYSARYIGELHAVDTAAVSGNVLLVFPKDSTKPELKVDDELVTVSRLTPIAPPLNPYQFDYRKYMEGLDVHKQLRLSYESYIPIKNPSTTVYGAAAKVRNTIIDQLKRSHFGKEELGIIQAILLGQRNDIPETVYAHYKNAGAVHILAVSGLHIGVLLILLQWLLKPLERLPNGKTLSLIIMVIFLWGFAFLAGLSASVVRAVTMFSFVAYALYLNRPSNTYNIMALSILFILLVVNPKLVFQLGFQMSYAAVFAIIWLYPLLQRFWRPKNYLLRKIWQLLSVSIAAQLGVLPISLYYFHQFPGLFFVSNLLIVPFLGLILGFGILILLLAQLNLLPDFMVTLYNGLIGWMNHIVGWVARQEAFVFKDISFDGIQLLLAYFLIIGLVLFLSRPTFQRTVTFLSGVLLLQLWTIHSVHRTKGREVTVLAHQTRNTIIFHQMGRRLQVFCRDSSRTRRLVNDYRVAERITKVVQQPLKESYRLGNQKLWILDSLGIYPVHSEPPEYVVLTQSPKINLERFIDSVNPGMLLADGSNYKSYVVRWKATCKKKKIPFHDTGKKGAYYFGTNERPSH